MGNLKGVKKVVRLKSALERLEASYNKFREAGEDKKPYSSTRNGKVVYHKGRSYDEECKRMKYEIERLKFHINLNS